MEEFKQAQHEANLAPPVSPASTQLAQQLERWSLEMTKQDHKKQRNRNRVYRAVATPAPIAHPEILQDSLPSSSQFILPSSSVPVHNQARRILPKTPELSYTQVFKASPNAVGKVEVEHKGDRVVVRSDGLTLADFDIKSVSKGWHLSFNLHGSPHASNPGTPQGTPNQRARRLNPGTPKNGR